MPENFSLKTREVRWFLSNPGPALGRWFEELPADQYTREAREDQYLLLPGQVALGVKIRDGRLELKYRSGTPRSLWVAPGVPGRLEEWEKFSLETGSAGPGTVGGGVEAFWLPVQKRRLATVVTISEDGTSFHALDAGQTAGLQLEYTALQVRGAPWATIGLEWPSDRDIRLPQTLLGELLGEMGLQAAYSMGYPEFLIRRVEPGRR